MFLLTDLYCETASLIPPPWQVPIKSVPASKPSAPSLPQPKKGRWRTLIFMPPSKGVSPGGISSPAGNGQFVQPKPDKLWEITGESTTAHVLCSINGTNKHILATRYFCGWLQLIVRGLSVEELRAKEATKGNITHFLIQKERIFLNQQKGRLIKGPLPAPVHMIFDLTDTAIASTFSFKSGDSNQPKVDEVGLSPGQVFQAAKFNHLLQQGRLGWSRVL